MLISQHDIHRNYENLPHWIAPDEVTMLSETRDLKVDSNNDYIVNFADLEGRIILSYYVLDIACGQIIPGFHCECYGSLSITDHHNESLRDWAEVALKVLLTSGSVTVVNEVVGRYWSYLSKDISEYDFKLVSIPYVPFSFDYLDFLKANVDRYKDSEVYEEVKSVISSWGIVLNWITRDEDDKSKLEITDTIHRDTKRFPIELINYLNFDSDLVVERTVEVAMEMDSKTFSEIEGEVSPYRHIPMWLGQMLLSKHYKPMDKEYHVILKPEFIKYVATFNRLREELFPQDTRGFGNENADSMIAKSIGELKDVFIEAVDEFQDTEDRPITIACPADWMEWLSETVGHHTVEINGTVGIEQLEAVAKEGKKIVLDAVGTHQQQIHLLSWAIFTLQENGVKQIFIPNSMHDVNTDAYVTSPVVRRLSYLHCHFGARAGRRGVPF
jgi:hypothetical protein